MWHGLPRTPREEDAWTAGAVAGGPVFSRSARAAGAGGAAPPAAGAVSGP